MRKSTLQFFSKLSVIILCLLGLTELALALWTIFDNRYRSLAYSLADVGYIDLWIMRYLSLCLLASSIITLVMCLILIWGLCSAHVFLFIASTMIVVVLVGELTISILTFASKYQTRITLIEQLPKLVITYRQGTDERARRSLDFLQSTFRCCGADGRLSYQNNVPLSCNMYSIGCLTRTIYFLDPCLDALAFVLLFFSLIKLFLIIYFYSFIYVYRKQAQSKRNNRSFSDDSSMGRHSSSFNSSSNENLSKKTALILPKLTYQDNGNQYEISNENNSTRKLSAISEKKDDSDESDSIRFKSSRQIPRKPIVKTRRHVLRQEEEHDSGVEHSSSEKSFDGNSSKALGFSKVFITSVSQIPPSDDDDESKRSLTGTLSENYIKTPKSILKKFQHNQPERIYSKISRPKPNPRITKLKQTESLF